MNAKQIRLVRKPKMKMFAPAQIVAGFEIGWDDRIQAWEMAKANPNLGGIYSFRIGRVVNGQVFITEMATDLEPSIDELSIAAAGALTKAGEVIDLGEWEQDEEESDSEPLDSSVVIVVAESLLEKAVAWDIIDGLPVDEDLEGGFDRLAGATREEEAALDASSAAGVARNLVEVLIEQSLDVERDLVERGNVIRRPFEYRFALMRDSDGDITSVMGAAVHKEGGALAVVDLEIPVVNKLIFASQNCSLADRVRVFSELVCLYCQLIRSAGGVGCVSSDLIRLAREAIRALAVVTAEYRNSQGGDRSDGSN